jgi:glycosyltransferase involved in cell wall biosynthesis
MSPYHPFIRLCQAAENAAYRDADLVVSMLPNVQDYVTSKGLPADRLAIVPNGISLDEWQGTQVAPLRDNVRTAIKSARAVGERVVVYTGSHGLPNSLDTLLDAAALLRDEPVRFILVGDGHERARLQRRVEVEGLTQVKMFGAVPKSQIAALLANVDMAYLGAPYHSIYRFGVSPNKMVDYMMARVPILYAIEAGNDPIADADCGLSLSAENASVLATAIREMAALPPERLQAMGNNGRQYAVANHTYNVLAGSFLDAIKRISSRL